MQMSKSFQNNGRRSIQIKFRQNSSYEIINSTYLANTLCIKRIFMESNSEYLEVTRTSKKLILSKDDSDHDYTFNVISCAVQKIQEVKDEISKFEDSSTKIRGTVPSRPLPSLLLTHEMQIANL